MGTYDEKPQEQEPELTPDAAKALADKIHAMLMSPGWSWFEAQARKLIEAQHKSIENAALDSNLPMKIAENRGAARGIRQMLEFPRNTLGALTAQLNPEPVLGGQPEIRRKSDT